MFKSLTNLPYIIAEIGVNHEGSIDKAKKLIDLAKSGGANAVKFQSYKADTIASKNSPAYWDEKSNPIRNQHELFTQYDNFNKQDYEELSNYCKTNNIDFASTPFDDSAVDFLEPLMKFYKISSSDITNIPFIRKIAKKNKPVILSTGASNYDEIDNAINEIKKFNDKDICLMHCILSYPTRNIDANLNMLLGLGDRYNNLVIGYSDHTKPDKNMVILVTAYLKGAMIIEKHFTDDKNLPGNDHFHSMDINDLNVLRQNLKIVSEIGGKHEKEVIKSEQNSRLYARRSIVLKNNVIKGDVLNETNLTYKRPGNGISPENWDKIIGNIAQKDLKLDHILQWSDILIKEDLK